MDIGIVGLTASGKTTLFSLLTGNSEAAVPRGHRDRAALLLGLWLLAPLAAAPLLPFHRDGVRYVLPAVVPLLLAASALFILAGLSVGLLISTVSRTQQEAFLTMFLFILPAIILSGFLYPVETMPELFQTLTLANPLRHYLEVVRGVFLKGAAGVDLLVQLSVLGTMAAGGMLTASWRFRRMLG